MSTAATAMNTILFAGYPGSGNSQLSAALCLAAELHGGGQPDSGSARLHEIYRLKSDLQAPAQKIPEPNPCLPGECVNIMTQEPLRYKQLDQIYFGSVSRIVLTLSDPFDALLCALLFVRYSASIATTDQLPPAITGSLESLLPGYAYAQDRQAFLEQFTLESLRDAGILDRCLLSFSNSGTVIPFFHAMAGPWAFYGSSYDVSGRPVLKLRQDHLVKAASDGFAAIASPLSEFLGCDQALLLDALRLQKQQQGQASEAQAQVSAYQPGTQAFARYFSRPALHSFANQYYSCLISLGYEDLVDAIFSPYKL